MLDVNDESPTFFPAIYNVSLPENVARDFKVVRLNCTDADVGLNAELSYFITGTAADPISLSRGAFHPDNIFPDCLAGGSGCIFQGCFPLWPSAQGAGTPSGKVQLLGHDANVMRESWSLASTSVLPIPKLVRYRPLPHGPVLAPLLAPAGLGFGNPWP